MVKVSVIIPLYNVENYIEKCVDSVLSQSLKNIEVILVDDGSPDNCGLIAEKYSKVDNRVKVIHKENGGLSSARNAGLDIAIGEYIAFVDSDDWIEADMLETMYQSAKINDSDISICNYNKVYETHVEPHFLKIDDEVIDIKRLGIQEYFYQYYFNYIHGHEAWNKLYKRKIIIENSIRFENNAEIFAEDLLFNLYFIVHSTIITSSKKSFYNYLQRTGSIMQSPNPNLINQFVNLIEKFVIYIRIYRLEKELKDIYPMIFFNLMSSSMYAYIRSGVSYLELKSFIKKVYSFSMYKNIMLQLLMGRTVSKFCNRTGLNRKNNINIRMFGLINFLGLNGLAAKIMIYKNSVSERT
ncbi:MAG: glycosyltransferase [Bacillus sp. (in: firmicutes)]